MDNKNIIIMPEPIVHQKTAPIVSGVGNINDKYDEDTEEVNNDEQS